MSEERGRGVGYIEGSLEVGRREFVAVFELAVVRCMFLDCIVGEVDVAVGKVF